MKRLVVSKESIRVFLGLFLLSLYAFTTGLAQYIYPKRIITIPLSFIIALLLLGCLKNVQLRSVKPMSLLAITLLLIVIVGNNQDLKHGVTTNLLFTTAYILFYVGLKDTDRWHQPLLKIFYAVGIFYAVCTIYSIVSPSFFYNVVVSVFSSYGTAAKQLAFNYNMGFVAGFTPNTGTNAIYLTLGMGVAFSLFFIYGKRRNLVLGIIMLVALLATGKRAHFAFFILAIVIVYYYLNCDQPVKRGFKIVAIIAVGMFLLVLLVNYVPFIANNVNAWIDRFSSDNIDSGRSGLRVIALSLFKENSLFGIGWDGFMYSYASIFGTQIAVHMNYLQLLCEVGIIGAIPFFAFFAISFTHVINSLKEIVVYSPNDTDAKFFLAFATYYQTFFLLYCLTGNPLYDASTLFPYLASCAIGEFYFWKLRWDIL